jgi:V8-like Glu-specific endopeptidase
MSLNLNRFIVSFILFTSFVSLFAQEKQYRFNKDKSELSLIVEKEKTKQLVVNTGVRKRGVPLLEAKMYTLDIVADTVGVWSVLPSKENIWKLTFEIPEAKGFFIGFDQFYLPIGSYLYVYEKSNLKSAIVYKHEDNPKGGSYSIENLRGNNVVLEYVAPAGTEKPQLHIADLGYKYSDEQGNLSGYNSSENSCMIDVNCPEGDFWQNQKKGVVQLRVRRNGTLESSSNLCSGTLINNTSEDKTPYILTAYHCFESVQLSDIVNTEFFFEYEKFECGIDNRPAYKYHKGAIPLVMNPINDGSDGVLLKLTDAIPDDWDVYYNGWDRTKDASTAGSAIHHPLGDVKKITLYDKPVTSGKWEDKVPVETHWIVTYSEGVTEAGSSGAPLFNQNGYIVGTLTGGENTCSSPNRPDYYGKFWYHWDQYPDENMHMSKYLDPKNMGVTRLRGLSAIDKDPDTDQPDLKAYVVDGELRIYGRDIMKKVRVVDLAGQVVYSKTDLSSSVHQIPVSDWRGGVYIVSAEMDKMSAKSVKVLK